jgi:hypothetical protein
MDATVPHHHHGERAPREHAGAVAAQRGEGSERTLRIAVALSATAALIHLWALPEHWAEWWGYGAFFLAMAVGQGLYALVLLPRPSQLLFSIGIWSNLAIIVLYVVSRTSGVPIGPHSPHIDPVGVLDMTATISEVGLVGVLVTLLTGTARRRTTDALLLVGGAMWLLRLTGVLS